MRLRPSGLVDEYYFWLLDARFFQAIDGRFTVVHYFRTGRLLRSVHAGIDPVARPGTAARAARVEIRADRAAGVVPGAQR